MVLLIGQESNHPEHPLQLCNHSQHCLHTDEFCMHKLLKFSSEHVKILFVLVVSAVVDKM